MTNKGSAEIVNMEDVRARRRANELDPDNFEHAGAHLKAVRETAGLSIEEVSENTHIKIVFLEAIEEMNLEALPSRPFAIGFAKGYAEALDLDPSQVVSRFKTDAGFVAPIEIQTEKFETAQAGAGDSERSDMSLIAIVAIIVFILWCALQISKPRDVTKPFSLAATPASAVSPAQPLTPPEALQGVPPIPLPRVIEAVLIEGVEPVYPQRCETEAAAIETVEIAFNVTLGGVISGERIAASSNTCFNQAALNAARRWRYSPRTVDGAPRPAYDQRHTFSFEKPL